MKKPSLVILSTNFGTDFSGGSRATCEVFNRVQHHFSHIVFVGSRVGTHSIKHFTFHRTKNWIHTLTVLNKLRNNCDIFYGDFYDSFLLGLVGVKYVFTYHDNWPELEKLNFRHRIYGLFYRAVYGYVFKHAYRLITVSNFKKTSMKSLTSQPVEVIYNGLKFNNVKKAERSGILMVGNIDQRKYKLAIELFDTLSNEEIQVDIYGHLLDKRVCDDLERLSFVNLKGFVEDVPYHRYQLLLHTSYIESFGMVFLEAINQGTPVIAFDCGGASEIVEEKNGVLIRPYDIQSMARSILGMRKNPIEADAESVSSFSWEKTASAYLRIFKNI